MKPMPVTPTRRPLELDVMRPAYGRRGQSTLAFGGKTSLSAWTSCPTLHQIPQLEQLSYLQGELQPEARRRDFQVSTEKLTQLVETVQHGVAVQAERGSGLLHRSSHQVGLESLEQLGAIAHLGVDQAPEVVRHEPLGQARVLGQHEVGDELVVAVHHPVRTQLSSRLDRLLRFEIRAGDAAQARVVAADTRPDASPRGARGPDRLILALR